MWNPPNTEDETPWPSAESSPSAAERSPFSMTPPSTRPACLPSTPNDVSPPNPVPTPDHAPAPSAAVAPVLGLTPMAATPPAATTPSEPKKRRVWPLAFLALFTIAASGLVSWAVASSVDESNDAATNTTNASATALPAVEDTATPTEPARVRDTGARAADLADEPFALAAEAIRPSVVQLNLGTSLGTGVIIDTDGTILTAAHVIGENTSVRVTFSDGSSADGTIVGSHTETDVAVVRVDPTGRNLVAAPLANGDDVRVGQIAVAVGSPFGFDQTVTAGIISAVDRIVRNHRALMPKPLLQPTHIEPILRGLDREASRFFGKLFQVQREILD